VDGVKVTASPEEGENDPFRLTLPLKYPIDVTVNVMSVLELCTRVTCATVLERLKSRGNSVMVSTGVSAALWVRPVLVVPVIVIGYVPPAVFGVVTILSVEVNIGLPVDSVNE
jgi:hypothetical protein